MHTVFERSHSKACLVFLNLSTSDLPPLFFTSRDMSTVTSKILAFRGHRPTYGGDSPVGWRARWKGNRILEGMLERVKPPVKKGEKIGAAQKSWRGLWSGSESVAKCVVPDRVGGGLEGAIFVNFPRPNPIFSVQCGANLGGDFARNMLYGALLTYLEASKVFSIYYHWMKQDQL